MLHRSSVLLAAVLWTGCAGSGWIGGGAASPLPDPETVLRRVEATEPATGLRGKYVVIDLERNELRFMSGRDELWRAPVGTGTGLYLRNQDGRWDFSTPTGVFQVMYKEQDPVWVLPDWYFVRNDLPIPGRSSPDRRVSGALGVAAVYLGEEIAIHGTERPELLGQRVSHGCIRLENRYALRLFHNVQVGTPVLIVGDPGPPPAELTSATDPVADAAGRRAAPTRTGPTSRLLSRLDEEIAAADRSSAWVETASELIVRGLRDDAAALRGVLARAGTTRNETFRAEYATFVADAYARGARRAVVSLARIPEAARLRAARALVEATMDLHAGDFDGPAAPWPTRRLIRSELGPEGRIGWDAIRAAEEAYREEHGDAPRVLR